MGLVATGAFTAGCLLTQVVTVPGWRSAPPDEALASFRRSGPATGAVLFPTEIVSTAVLTGLAVAAGRRQDPSAGPWAGAAGSMAATVLLLPLHFAAANRRLLSPEFRPEDVAAELRSWNTWNGVRTGLGLLATALAVAATGRTIAG